MRLPNRYLSVSLLVALDRHHIRTHPAGLSVLAMSSTSSSSSTPKACVPCSGLNESALLSRAEAESEIANLGSLWILKESDAGVLSLVRTYTARSFQSALDSINAMGVIAERESHHPNFHLTNYRDVAIEVYTHKLNGLTKNDFLLAVMLNKEVNVDYSPKWLKEHPVASSASSI
jgi:4a-hydroxytetrahydrobiopterin dehydratase